MTDVDTIRLIIADPIQFDRAVQDGDGVSTQFQVPNTQIIPGSVLAWVASISTVPAAIESPTGLVTFAPAPGNGVSVVITYRWAIFTDADIQTFLDLEGGNIKLAAAQAIDTIATSEVLVQKRIEQLDLKTDGPAEARALREHAKTLRAQAEDDEEKFGDQEGLIDIAEMALSPFALRNMRIRRILLDHPELGE